MLVLSGIAYGIHYAVTSYISGRVETLYREKLAKLAIERQNQEIEKFRLDLDAYKSSIDLNKLKIIEEVPKVVIVKEEANSSDKSKLEACQSRLKNIDDILSSAW